MTRDGLSSALTVKVLNLVVVLLVEKGLAEVMSLVVVESVGLLKGVILRPCRVVGEENKVEAIIN